MCKKYLRNIFKNYNWVKALLTVCVVGGLVFGVGLPIFAPLGIEAFLSWASVIIVLYAVWISVQSLNLSKATQRPFLTTVEEPQEPEVIGEATNPRIILHIGNTGNLPADRISILCALYTSTNMDIGISLRHDKTALAPPIYFPGVTVQHTFYLEQEHFKECQKGRFTVRILIKYGNKIAKKTCNTQRSFIYEALNRTPLSPINSTHRDDWWD
ncbi:hypothetical protein ES703_45646 [subsurface metagenome]